MSTIGDGSQFSAADPALGYLYQVRSALLWALQRLKSSSEFLVSVETLDDVAFETTGGSATELLQTKHHLSSTANLTDASADLWKTLRIWFEGHASKTIPTTAHLLLVTTGTAPDGSTASYLRSVSRDVNAAQQALNATASTSTSKTNKSGYAAYLKASVPARKAVLDRVTVIDAAPTISDLEGDLTREVFWAAGREQHSAFLDRLEGWWLRRVLKQLVNAPHDRIGSVELEAQMSDLREQFKHESLPIDDDLLEFTLDDATRSAHEETAFVRQLEIIKAGKRRIALSIRDYYRAFEQRSRWLRDDLVVELELHKYEKRLVEEWEVIFEAMRDNLGTPAADEAKEQAARSVLAWAERAPIAIRSGVTEPFISRGSFHMLADEVRIGWHPEFQDRLAALLRDDGGAS